MSIRLWYIPFSACTINHVNDPWRGNPSLFRKTNESNPKINWFEQAKSPEIGNQHL